MWVNNAIEDKCIIGARTFSEVFTCIDASYAVNDNTISHTGGDILMGYGIIHGKSSKQKINVNISTEAELVGISVYIQYNLWLKIFLKEQGYEIKDNVVFQDNKSSILMEKNGRNSCMGKFRYINVRYFFRERQNQIK